MPPVVDYPFRFIRLVFFTRSIRLVGEDLTSSTASILGKSEAPCKPDQSGTFPIWRSADPVVNKTVGGQVKTVDHYLKSEILMRFVATSITDTSKSLNALQEETGIHRSKLGRMRLCRCPVTLDEAEIVFRAVGRPARALFALACLGEDCVITPEVLSYLDQFLSKLPTLIERLNELGSTLNPKWAVGSIHHIAGLMAEHAERLHEADTFRSPYGTTD